MRRDRKAKKNKIEKKIKITYTQVEIMPGHEKKISKAFDTLFNAILEQRK